MTISITQEHANKLFDRKEISATIMFAKATPTRAEIRKLVCEKLGLNSELVALPKVKPEYGIKRVTVVAHAYSNAAKMKQYEPYHVLLRDKLVEKKVKKAAEPAKK